MSAYACEPGKGSEPEVGWQWALQMARYHDVTVVTRANNRPAIEQGLAALHGVQPLPTFVYHDCSQLLLDLKRRAKAVKLYYLLWQRSARDLVARLHRKNQYDLMHHVTFAGFRYLAAIWGHGVPCIWGPIGGIESIPLPLLPWRHPSSLFYELLRNINNLLQATPFQVLPKRAHATTLILVSTQEMQRTFARLGYASKVMPTIGLNPAELPFRPHRPVEGPLRLLFVGQIITLKGVDLALEALKQSQTDAVLTFVGTGNYLVAAKRLTARLGLRERARFEGRLARAEVLKVYPDSDVFLFPSLHDTGSYAVLEAMFNELPIICLDCGGPALLVKPGCGVKVPLGGRAKTISDLAKAIRSYDQNRAAVLEHGKAAHAVAMRDFDWNKKGSEMNECYHETVARSDAVAGKKKRGTTYAGIGTLASLANRMFSLTGLTAAALGLILIGALGFLSVGHLKRQANWIVRDTLPGLSLAGQANSSMAQSFNCVLLLLVTDDAQQQSRLRQDIDTFSDATGSYLVSYERVIYGPKDKTLFDQVQSRRQAYLQVRDRALGLFNGHNQREALALYQRELLPAYEQYKAAADTLVEYNVTLGKTRGETIMRVCTITQWVVACMVIVVFLVGFLIGLFK